MITEGYMDFRGYKTYYRIVGESKGNKKPLILMHGGPGSTHNYFEGLDVLAEDGRMIVMYDQLGCGNSYVDNHPEWWNKETWKEELAALRAHLGLDEVHLLGQSWGGMLAICYMIDEKPEGVKSLILSSTLSSSSLWAKEQHRMITYMSEEDQRAIKEAEETNNFSGAAYELANEHFMLQHASGPVTSDSPKWLRRPRKSGKEAYLYGWGPNEYTPTGTLADFEYTDRLNEISVPSLIISGTDDLCTPLVAKTMYDHLPNATWELFPNARHMCFVDGEAHYIELVSKWMNDHD